MGHFCICQLKEILFDEIFFIHNNMRQGDTSGTKHTDPGDITFIMCLQKNYDD